MKSNGCLVGVDEGEEFDIWVATVSGRVIVTEVIDRVDGTKDVVTYEPIAKKDVICHWGSAILTIINYLQLSGAYRH